MPNRAPEYTWRYVLWLVVRVLASGSLVIFAFRKRTPTRRSPCHLRAARFVLLFLFLRVRGLVQVLVLEALLVASNLPVDAPYGRFPLCGQIDPTKDGGGGVVLISRFSRRLKP